MLAISCKKNEATDPGTFSPSQKSGNVLTTIVRHVTNSDGTPQFYSEITINFSEANRNQFDTSLANAFGNSEQRNLTNNVEISYDNASGKVSFATNITSQLTNAQTNTYKLTFSLANNTGLNNPTRSIDIDVSLIKTAIVDTNMISNAMKTVVFMTNEAFPMHGFIFDTNSTKYESYTNMYLKSFGGAGDDKMMTNAQFTNALISIIKADENFLKYFSDIAFTNTAISEDNKTNTIDVSFINAANVTEQTNRFQILFELDKGYWSNQ